MQALIKVKSQLLYLIYRVFTIFTHSTIVSVFNRTYSTVPVHIHKQQQQQPLILDHFRHKFPLWIYPHKTKLKKIN